MRLERNRFERWLRGKPADHIVGHSHDNCGCPLATYHQEASGGCEVVISSDPNGFGYKIDRGDGDRPMPAWADAFAFLVDNGDRGAKITAGLALEFLENIEP